MNLSTTDKRRGKAPYRFAPIRKLIPTPRTLLFGTRPLHGGVVPCRHSTIASAGRAVKPRPLTRFDPAPPLTTLLPFPVARDPQPDAPPRLRSAASMLRSPLSSDVARATHPSMPSSAAAYFRLPALGPSILQSSTARNIEQQGGPGGRCLWTEHGIGTTRRLIAKCPRTAIAPGRRSASNW